MAILRVDGTNFAEGARGGTRIIPSAGVRLDFSEWAADGATLGLWHLHDGSSPGEGTGLADSSGGGQTLQNHGATPADDGYRFVREQGHHMDAAFAGQPARSQVTLECWVTGVVVADGYRLIAAYGPNGANRLYLLVHRDAASPGNSYLLAGLAIGGVDVGVAQWNGCEAVFLGEGPWHLAAVLDAPNTLRLFVNGVLRAEDSTGIVALPAATHTLSLGRWVSGWPDYDLSGVLDEVRLSVAARYAAGFTPPRYRASGTYASPVLDCARRGAPWLRLSGDVALPADAALTWETRASDEQDGAGQPLASWRPYSGNPADLAVGRYLQWRATLSAPPTGASSPTLQSAEAQSSEAGYNVYHATGPGPECLDYAEPLSRTGPGIALVETVALGPGAVHWFGIRPVRADGVELPTAESERRLELSASGEPVPDRPAGALTVEAWPEAGGAVRLVWGYRVGLSGVAPAAFRIFRDRGTGTVDYSSPIGEEPYRTGQAWFSWTTGPLADGVAEQLAVRAVSAEGLMDEQPAVVQVTPDASAPGQVDALQAEVIL